MVKIKILSLLLGLLISWSVSGQPAQLKGTVSGQKFTITKATTISYQADLKPLAEYLGEYTGLQLANNRMSGDGSIVLSTDQSLAKEHFRFSVKESRIEIAGGDHGGLFNGIQALFRMMPAQIYAKACQLPVQLAQIEAQDGPRYQYRGMMLDVARTWMDSVKVKRYINLLSYHNINKLHLHLSDDEGWRIEIKSHPELAEIGGYRGKDSPVRAVYGKWGEKYGGYYTQDQLREIIDYAALRNIEIIPEIDLPGHSRNIASVVKPEIRCNYPPDLYSTNGYDYRSAWCVAREENYTLLADILGEVCDIFPSKYIHIGGDEVEASQWKRCPDCSALMAKEGMSDAQQLEDYFINRLNTILEAKGKAPAVWSEAAKRGQLTQNSLVYGWESTKVCAELTTKGYKTVVMPGEYFYFDMRQSAREDGHDWAAIFDASKVYGFDPTTKGIKMKNVVGLQGAFFSEAYVSHQPEKPDYIDYMCFPRICALARIAWGSNSDGWDNYYNELKTRHYDRMAAMGICFRLSPPKVNFNEGTLSATVEDGSEIWYATEGLEAVNRYSRPLKVSNPHKYLFFTRYKTARSPRVAHPSHYKTAKPTWQLTTSMGESKQFPYTNAMNYRGLTRTARACKQKDWVLYTFDTPVKCREMYLQTGNKQLPKTILTTGYAEVSYDGVHFERRADLEKGSITLRPAKAIKAVRLISTCDDNGTPYVTIQPPIIKPVL